MSLKESEHIQIFFLILAFDRLQISTIYDVVCTILYRLVQVKRVKETVIVEYYFVIVF